MSSQHRNVRYNAHHFLGEHDGRTQLLAGAMMALCAVATPATPAGAATTYGNFELPALVAPAGTEHHVGKVIWADLVTTDLPGAERFYGALFGWTFRAVESGSRDFAVAYMGETPVAGMVRRPPSGDPSRRPSWLPFIAVRDVGEARQVALAQGARVISAPHNYPQRGEQAVFADPQGAVFAVLASSSGDPPDVLADTGEWIWSSLITRDPDADAAFYQKVFGYQVYDMDAAAVGSNTPASGDAKVQHLVLASDDVARGSANGFPANRSDIHPHWINFVRVDDAEESARKATSLGGRVLVAPHVDRHGGRISLLADPAGAPFGVMEWADDHSEGAAK